jgi:hypothetical protein
MQLLAKCESLFLFSISSIPWGYLYSVLLVAFSERTLLVWSESENTPWQHFLCVVVSSPFGAHNRYVVSHTCYPSPQSLWCCYFIFGNERAWDRGDAKTAVDNAALSYAVIKPRSGEIGAEVTCVKQPSIISGSAKLSTDSGDKRFY